ncbi:hypothetical protein WSM22_04350 [Cytophagales bacterium WSM2-2]|nr:hypothetical protein WSM22_04350 [Cytophagales bacterium WSM2-2]
MNQKAAIFSSLVVTAIVVSINSCIDQKISSRPQAATSTIQSQNVFNENVGALISKSTGNRWIGNFAASKTRLAISEYYIPSSSLSKILENKSCVGICLYYAQDAAGSLHVIPIGVDRTGKTIAQEVVSVRNAELNWKTAVQWITNYSGGIKAHFFGNKTYFRLLNDQHASTIRISFASNDTKAPQMLLSNAAVSNPDSYEDESFLCPPVCPTFQ